MGPHAQMKKLKLKGSAGQQMTKRQETEAVWIQELMWSQCLYLDHSCTPFHRPKSLQFMKADASTSHLSKEPFPAPSGYQQPLPQKGHKLLLCEFPALQLVGAFAVHPTEQVRLPGFC